MKKLYFTDDFSPENVAKLKEQGYILRDSRAYKVGDFIEACDEVAGNPPKAYLEKYSALAPENSELPEPTEMKVEELKELLTLNEVEFDPKAKKEELVALATELLAK